MTAWVRKPTKGPEQRAIGLGVEHWLPLAPLLPRCDAVVCHAGSGTTLASLTSGLPLVLAPQGADQFTNAAACQRAGVARVLPPGALSSTAVRDAVLAILRPGSTERDPSPLRRR